MQEQIDKLKKDIEDLKVFSVRQDINPETAKILSQVIKTLESLEVNTLNVKEKAGFFGANPIARQSAIAKPTITGVSAVDIANLKTAVDSLIDTLKNIGITS
jgi:hypothetical protein